MTEPGPCGWCAECFVHGEGRSPATIVWKGKSLCMDCAIDLKNKPDFSTWFPEDTVFRLSATQDGRFREIERWKVPAGHKGKARMENIANSRA